MDTYPLVPNRISNATPEFKTNIVKSESGHEQRSPNYSQPKKTFRLYHQLLNLNELAILTNFFVAKKGSYMKFYFVNHIDNVTYECRFVEDKLPIEFVNAYIANVTVELVTC